MAKGTQGVHYREALAIALLGLSLLIALSLLSLDPKDSAFNVSQPNLHTHNVAGPLGARIAHVLAEVFGLAAFGIPVFLGSAAVAWAVGHNVFRWEKLGWFLLALVSGSCLLDVFREMGESWARWANVSSPGGFVGENVHQELLLPVLGPLGGELVSIFTLFVSLLLLYELHPIRWALSAVAWVRNQWETWEEKRLTQAGLAGKLVLAERRLLKEKRQLEKRLAKEKVSRKEENGSPERLLDLPIVDAAQLARPRRELGEPREKGKPAPADRTSLSCGGPPQKESLPRSFVYPDLELLTRAPLGGSPVLPETELREKAQILLRTLATFGIEATPGTVTRGPTITRFEIYPAAGVRVDRIRSLERDLARALKAERIHILAPIPGKDSVGIEVPNDQKIPVVLRDLLEDAAWTSTQARIPIPLGKDVYGKTLVADLADMPHLLIAGATGSGKSVFLNALLVSLLYRFNPRELRLVLVDPKQVELLLFEGLPHLVVPVVVEPKRVLVALRWLTEEMDRRYRLLAQSGLRNIVSYNQRQKSGEPIKSSSASTFCKEGESTKSAEREKSEPSSGEEWPSELPYIVLVIDELADLMQATPAEVETAIARLCAKARAAGIHLVLATQTPRREVVTGVIKANIPCRIAFQVASGVDSRVILDEGGAENLLGRGDFLYLPPGSSRWVRGQGAYVSEEEVRRVVDHWVKQGGAGFEPTIHQALCRAETEDALEAEDQELINKCLEVIWQERKASTSLLQRRLRLGYNRAAWVIDWLERKGIVGPENGARPREVLLDLDGPPPKI
ncbi:FtsK/SpoIIIE family DNA translocase [Candidatus Methylacidithermus pantelleriae]|uniref:DNA segregation ATPase FtsK/SpoIIIE n=1 Tax=Candidatus Methylacidithermus pantelleriae TaxID=2744239 RepID=A0A8J2FPF6_9BACT|nr:DNA translocase FtsK [Candidatus Methylacidithermus pantelleriae]CAF0702415.1 DNA segregation ATPase FtsK/SpoIIIE [Candidatus Methylacidithermus pantelleriae]